MHKHCRSLAVCLVLSIAAVLGLSAVASARMPAQRAQRVVTILVKGGNPVIKVNGKEYIPGTPITEGSKIEVSGGVGIILDIGGVTVRTMGATLTLAGTSLRVLSGAIAVTQAGADATAPTQAVAAGESVKVETETVMVTTSQSTTSSQTSTSEETTTTTTEPAPNNPKQNLSPSSP
ncbi:MAG: hypothetical protein HY921_06080 [Elusimicrobia bacterium]|nr:hypothetical protein [Elusimicrobiota bacterium]